MREEINFIFRLLLCFIPFSVFYFLFFPITIYVCYFLLLSYHPLLTKDALTLGGRSFVFLEACIASAAYWLFWVLIVSLKDVNVKKKIKALLSCYFLFFLMNIFRIILLIFISLKFGDKWFDLVHLTFWKFVSGVYVALVWIIVIKIYKINAVPLYDDLKFFYKKSFFTRRGSGKREYPQS